MKKCSKCNEIKELNEFNKCKANKDGYKGLCRYCTSIETKKYRIENHEKVKINKEISRLLYFDKHREKNRQKSARYHNDNKEKESAYHKQYRIDNYDKCINRERNYKKYNPEKIRKSNKTYCETHIESEKIDIYVGVWRIQRRF